MPDITITSNSLTINGTIPDSTCLRSILLGGSGRCNFFGTTVIFGELEMPTSDKFSQVPPSIIQRIFAPYNSFSTFIHEIGHSMAFRACTGEGGLIIINTGTLSPNWGGMMIQLSDSLELVKLDLARQIFVTAAGPLFHVAFRVTQLALLGKLWEKEIINPIVMIGPVIGIVKEGLNALYSIHEELFSWVFETPPSPGDAGRVLALFMKIF